MSVAAIHLSREDASVGPRDRDARTHGRAACDFVRRAAPQNDSLTSGSGPEREEEAKAEEGAGTW
jgi:hypothetical protein